jgi:hypothetical protein
MKSKFLIGVMLSLMFSLLSGIVISEVSGFPALPITGLLFLASLVPMPGGVLRAGVYKEIWTAELIRKFRHEGTFLTQIQAFDSYVNNEVIHLVELGADPDVLINNTSYPIGSQALTDTDIPLSLNKYQTKGTPVTDDELYAISYDKMATVQERHRLALEEKTADHAAWNLAPSTHSANTPLILTTGASNGATVARKRMTPNDIITAKRKLDDLKVPAMNRVLVLCNDHVEDLLRTDEVFANQYKNIQAGTVLNLYGFTIYQYVNNPVYVYFGGAYSKKAFGAAYDPNSDFKASFFFYAPRAFKATGSVTMYYKEAETQYQQTEMNFRLYHIVAPKKNIGFGAIVSDVV